MFFLACRLTTVRLWSTVGLSVNTSSFPLSSNRALYFTSYSQAKQRFNRIFPYESPLVHLSSAITAGRTVSDLGVLPGFSLSPDLVP